MENQVFVCTVGEGFDDSDGEGGVREWFVSHCEVGCISMELDGVT